MTNNEKKQYRKDSISIVLLFSVFIFFILAITVVTVMIILYIMEFTGVLVDITSTSVLILLMSITSLLIGALVMLITIRVPLKPVLELVNGMKSLAKGKYETRIKFGKVIGRHPAMSGLADSFNTLATELENTEMFRSDFINNLSHEFKTPMVSILGFTRLLKKTEDISQIKDEYLAIIEEESLRLIDMATNVLNVTKIENQVILTDKTKFNVSEQIRNCILVLEQKWVNKNLEMVLDFDEYYITANEELLKQVWINILDNAIKFTDEYGEIKVGISKDKNSLSVAVSNTGSYIPEEERSRIFAKFYQADKSHSSEGSGLGLVLVKHIVNLHKGDIKVESNEAVTTFIITLPNAV